MCGITGIIGKKTSDQKDIFKKMLESLYHRGPDEQGIFEADNCLLGHTRFSIIDLKHGQQPMLSDNKEKIIVFNGEIYGFKDLKKQYQYNYQTDSDTELLLAMYKHDGPEMCKKLNGMFAFALWDKTESKLICARDRFGEKPFYYSITKTGQLVFASELKAILISGLIKPELSLAALEHYLLFLTPPANNSIFKNIFVLPAGHYLVWQDNQITVTPYWQPNQETIKITPTAAKEKLDELLRQSIQRQLVADVPVGTFLSGGLDSSTVTAIASKYKKGLETFSFGFDQEVNELPFAKSVAKKYQTNHHELKATDYDVADILLKMTEFYDEPFADSSNIPLFLISQFARKKVRVVLTGDGADELLGGYDHYQHLLNGKSHWQQKILSYFYRLLKKVTKNNKWDRFIRSTRFWKKMSYADYLETQGYFSQEEVRGLMLDTTHQPYIKGDQFKYQLNSASDLMKFDVKNNFVADMLVKNDRASMAVPLELRSPFLDKDVADFCLSLPDELKINNGRGKFLLRETFAHLWPSDIINRPKQGFGAPVNKWLKLPKVKELSNEFLADKKKLIFTYINFEKTQDYKKRDNYQTWILLVLSLWFEKWGKYIKK